MLEGNLFWLCTSFNLVFGVIFSDIMEISSSDSELSRVISPKFLGDGLDARFPLPKFLGSGALSARSIFGVMETVA